MNLKRIGHLVGFELRRIKKLVIAAWIFLAIYYLPLLVGNKDKEWGEVWGFFVGGGAVGFVVCGIFLATWSGLLGQKLFPARPVLKGEIRLVSWGVLLGVLVAPVLAVTFVSLWLYGVSGEVIWRGVWVTALTIVPLWMGVRYFAKYAGSLRMTLVCLVIVGCLMIAGASFGFLEIIAPWMNGVGVWSGEYQWVATLGAVILMMGAWGLVKRWGVVGKLSVVVLSVVIGWVAMYAVTSEREMGAFKNGFSEKVELTGKVRGFRSARTVELSYELSHDREEGLMVWEVLGSLKDEEGREYGRGELGYQGIPKNQIRGVGRDWVAKTLIAEDAVYLDRVNGISTKSGRRLMSEMGRRISVTVSEDYSRGEAVRLSGRLAGRHCFVETLVKDLARGEGKSFREENVVGEVIWKDGEYEGDPKLMELTVREPVSMTRFEKRGSYSPEENWIVHLSYPESGVVIEGELRWLKKGTGIGGVKQWSRQVKFGHSELWRFEVKDEVPLVSVYRVRVEETGYAKVKSEPVVLVEKDSGQQRSDFATMVIGARKGIGAPPTDEWVKRPDPVTVHREELGGWFRELESRYHYAAKVRDLAQYAERWDDLFLKTAEKVEGSGWAWLRSFADGATNEGAEVAIATLVDVTLLAEVLVERGWGKAAKGKVEELIRGGNRESDILRLGIFLEVEGIEEAVLEGLLLSDDWELYEAARTRLKIGKEIEGMLDERLRRVNELTERSWSVNRDDYKFSSVPWVWLLHEGRRKDLESCLEWIRVAHEGGRYGDWEGNYRQRKRFESVLFDYKKFKEWAKAGKLRAELFDWDPVLRRWIYNEKGEVK